MKIKRIIKYFLIVVLTLMLVFLIRPATFLLSVYLKDKNLQKHERVGYTNDVSNLNETKISAIIKPAVNEKTAAVQLAMLVKLAIKQGKKIALAGSRHSMGGHTIYPDAIVLDMSGVNYLKFNKVSNTLTAGAGATWAQIVPFLNKIGRSVAVMQSNNSFTVGGSISVNCHGWTPGSPPIASTVRSLRLINAQGELVTCSRDVNAELFSLVVGGYGLFGVIVDVELNIVDNAAYTAQQYEMKSSEYVQKFKVMVAENPAVGMAYGRINVSKQHFMEEAILAVYLIEKDKEAPKLQENALAALRRTVFRGSVGSDYGKKLRWDAEKLMTLFVSGKEFSRNQLMNESVDILENHDPNTVDILQEYFIPPDSINKFIEIMKREVPKSNTDLLNITLRDVKKDKDTFLAYADQHMIGFVLSFNQERTIAADLKMQQLARKLTDGAIALNGTYYLPYRLQATPEQFQKAYPQAKAFFLLKKKYDPTELFNNQFYLKYKD